MDSGDEQNEVGLAEMEFLFMSADCISTLNSQPAEENPPEIEEVPMVGIPVKVEGRWEDEDSEFEESEFIDIPEEKVDIELLQLHQDSGSEVPEDPLAAPESESENDAANEDDAPSNCLQTQEQIFENGITREEVLQQAWKLLEETDYLSDKDDFDSSPDKQGADHSYDGERSEYTLKRSRGRPKKTHDISEKKQGPSKQTKKNVYDKCQKQQRHLRRRPKKTLYGSKKKKGHSKNPNKNVRDKCQEQQRRPRGRPNKKHHIYHGRGRGSPKNTHDGSEKRHISRRKTKTNARDSCEEEQSPSGEKAKETRDKSEVVENHSEQRNNNACPECGRVCRTPRLLAVHLLAHKQEVMKCLVCGKTFFSKESRDKHVMLHFDEDDRAEKEDISCGETKTNAQDSCEEEQNPSGGKAKEKRDKSKIVENHSEQKNNNVCPECGRFCRTPRLLEVHLLAHKQKVMKCVVCDKTFFSKAARDKHVMLHFDEESPINFELPSSDGNQWVVVCPVCTEPFETEGELNKHLLSHSGTVPEDASAAATKTTKNTTAATMITSTNTRTETKTSSEKKRKATKKQESSSLKSEKSTKQSKSSPTKSPTLQDFECKICTKKFNCESNLSRHLKMAHSDPEKKKLSPKKMRKSCQPEELSAKDCVYSIILTNYIRRGVLPLWKCSVCDDQFINQGDLLRHSTSQHSFSDLEAAAKVLQAKGAYGGFFYKSKGS